jgi:hypothetical protein
MVNIVQEIDGHAERRKNILAIIRPLILKPYKLYSDMWVDFDITIGFLRHSIAYIMIPNNNKDWDKRDVTIHLYDQNSLSFVQTIAEAIEKTGSFDVTITKDYSLLTSYGKSDEDPCKK